MLSRRSRALLRRVSLGFVLAEFLLALVVVSTIVGIAAQNYAAIRQAILGDDQATQLVHLASDVQRLWGNARSFTTVSAVTLSQLDLVRRPMRYDGSAMYDHWGNTMGVSGGTRTFALSVGGAAFPMAANECSALANRMATIASAVAVGNTAAVGSGAAAGRVTGGFAVKSNGAFSEANLGAGCSQAGAVIAMEFR